jgi:alkylation response protein AidB-like acyl-CoA dehydrogenase
MTAAGIEELELARAMDAGLEHLLPMHRLLEAAAADTQLDASTQRDLLALGGVSIAVPEALGGLELPCHQCARLAAVGGRRLLPSAIRGETFVLAPVLATLATDGDDQAAGWLGQLLAGELRGAAVAIPDERNETVAYLPERARLLACLHDGEVTVVEFDADWITADPIVGLDPGQGAVLVNCQRPLGGSQAC